MREEGLFNFEFRPGDLVTNDLIRGVNGLDPKPIAAAARNWKD